MSQLDDFFQEVVVPAAKKRQRRAVEAKAQKEIVAWLLERGVVVAVTDAGVLSKMGLNMACGVPRGWPDLTCCLPGGMFLGVEVKAPGGRQSKAQKKCQEKIEFNNGIYILARSVEEVREALQKEVLLGNIRGFRP